VDVGLGPFRVSARPDRADDLAFTDRGADREADRPEMDQGHRVTICGADRQAEPVARHLPGEGDDAGSRSARVGSGRSGDVDAAVLAARIRIVPGGERPEHLALDGPAPRGGAGRAGERDQQHGDHDDQNVARFENHAGNLPGRSAVVKFDYREAR